MIFKLVCKPGETEQEARERFADVYFDDDISFLGVFIKLMEAQTQAGKRCGECFAAKKPAAVLFYRRLYVPGQPERDHSYNPVLSLALCPEHDLNEICMLLCNEFGAFYVMVKDVKKNCQLELDPDYIEPLFIITLGAEDYGSYERCFCELKRQTRRELVAYFEARGNGKIWPAIELSEVNGFKVEEFHTEAEIEALINE